MSNKRKPLQMSLLALFIVVMPLGSWYFLNKGYDYYEKAIKELQDYGPMPDFQLLTQTGEQLTRTDVEGKMAVVAFVDPDNAEQATTMEYLSLVHKQFDKRNDLIFLIHLLTQEPQSPQALEALAEKYEMLDEKQCYFITGESQSLRQLMGTQYKIPDLNSRTEEQPKYNLRTAKTGQNDYPYLVLIDIGQHICNYYDANDKPSVNRMVEHIALKLPREKEEDPILVREKEK